MRIMIVDDDVEFAEILAESLEEGGDFSVVCRFENTADVKSYMDGGGLAEIDCVLLDLQLPKSINDRIVSSSGGIDIACEMRNKHGFFGTIIVLSNSRSLHDGERAIEAGCDGYVCKHVKMQDTAAMITQLKTAMAGDLVPISREMRYVFLRGEISPKEACLMSLLCSGKSWDEIAKQLNYKNAKAAANIADRIYDKLLTPEQREQLGHDGFKKRQRAVEIWKNRNPVISLAP